MNDPETPQALTLEDRLKAIAYQFIALYERWSEDRQVLMKQASDNSALLQRFEQQLKQFEAIDAAFRKQLSAFIRQEAAQMGEDVGEVVGQAASQAATAEVKSVTDSLQRAVDAANQAIQAQTDKIKRVTWVFWTMVAGVSILGGLAASLFVYQVMIKPPALTKDQQVTLQEGQFIQTVWPKLSKKEQHRLGAIAKGEKSDSTTDTTSAEAVGDNFNS